VADTRWSDSRAGGVLPALPVRILGTRGHGCLPAVAVPSECRPPRDSLRSNVRRVQECAGARPRSPGGRTTAYVDEVDLLNGFADITIPFGDQANITLRGGRQELIFGSQRLVGPGDFSQIPKAFDGAAGYVRIGEWTVIPFWAMAVPVVHKYRFNESAIDQQLNADVRVGDETRTAAMSNQISWHVELQVKPGQLDPLRALTNEMVESTKTKRAP
jgi:Alginate export